jgi:hypothetical protein
MAFLPKIHLNHNSARSIVYGPLQFGGLAIKTLYSIQSIGQLTLFVGHMRLRDKTCKLLRISLSYLQLTVGSTTSILNMPSTAYDSIVEKGWLQSFWAFLTRSDFSIQLTDQWLPSITREHDIALMDHFIAQGFSASKLRLLNQCRLYLQVITLADLTSADGKHLIPDVFIGCPLTDRKSTLKWPNQQRPTTTKWELWSTALCTLQPRNRLNRPLGTCLGTSFHQSWFWFRDPFLPKLYHIDPVTSLLTVCTGHLPSRRVTRSCPLIVFDTTDKIPLTTLPLNLLPATVVTDRHTGLTSAVHGPARPTSISTQPLAPILSSALLVEHAYYRSLLPKDVPSLGDLHDIMNAASEGLEAISRTLF